MRPDKELFSSILEKYYSAMTAAEQRIADYLLKNPHESITFSVSTLARKTDTSEATVVRFAKTLGFTGFLELKSELLKRASHTLASTPRYDKILADADKTVVCAVADLEVSNLSETIQRLDVQAFQDCVSLLKKAHLVYTLGSGMSSFVAKMAAYQLTLLGKRSVALQDSPATFEDQLALAKPRADVLWIFSYPPYSPSVLNLAKHAQSLGVATLAITDRSQSPIAAHVHPSLCAANNNVLPTNSMGAALVLVTALLSQLAKDRLKSSRESSEQLDV